MLVRLFSKTSRGKGECTKEDIIHKRESKRDKFIFLAAKCASAAPSNWQQQHRVLVRAKSSQSLFNDKWVVTTQAQRHRDTKLSRLFAASLLSTGSGCAQEYAQSCLLFSFAPLPLCACLSSYKKSNILLLKSSIKAKGSKFRHVFQSYMPQPG
jgi:hypothetical protein